MNSTATRGISEGGSIRAALRRVRKGLIGRYLAAMDRRFDKALGTETRDVVMLDQLHIESASKSYGVEYAATPAMLWTTLLEVLPASLETFAFVDYGCGKGRNLILAARSPFRAVIGVDFSHELVEVAQRNTRRACPGDTRIAIVHRDAAEFEPPPGDVVAFLYNPFGPEVLERVVERLEARARSGAHVWIVYYNPLYADVITRSPQFRERPYSRRAALRFLLMSRHRAAAFESVGSRA